MLIKRAGGNILSPNTEASLQEYALLLEEAQRCVLSARPLSLCQNLLVHENPGTDRAPRPGFALGFLLWIFVMLVLLGNIN